MGHAPDASPYRHVRASQVLTVAGGYLAGSAGSAGVGPSGGPLVGVQFDLHLGGPGVAKFGVYGAELGRVIVDPRRGVGDRVRDTVTQSVILAEAGILFMVTGEKTWHRLAPYAGASLGLALGGAVPEEVPADSGGFRFGNRFQLAPHLGVRWHVGQRVSLRFEGRDIMWRLAYPGRFFTSPADAPDDPPVLDPRETKSAEWTHHPSLFIAVGYAIRM